MSVKVFILGRPGSGKSSVAQLIGMFAQNKNWITQHFYDYKLLQEMYLREIKQNIAPKERSFHPKGPEAHHGFDVTNFLVLDIVLDKMTNAVRSHEQASTDGPSLFLLEFARNDYSHALQRFGYDLLQNAYLLYIHVDIDTCIERIYRRVESGTQYNHFVSEDIMRGYYRNDDWSDNQLQKNLILLQNRGICVYTKEIDNTGSYLQLIEKVKEIVENSLLRETGALPIVSRMKFGTELAK